MTTVTIPALRTVPACELPPQVFVGTMPTREAFRAPTGYSIPSKPREGGFWTSGLNDAGTSGWIDWCREQDFGGVDVKAWWMLSTAIATPVLEIDSVEDLERLDVRYGRSIAPGLSLRYLDFDAMVADRWAGLHLTDEGQLATRYTDPYSFYGWDCESTLWFQWLFDPPVTLERSA